MLRTAFKRQRPSLVLADLVMPELGGAELARCVGMLPGPLVPVLLTSASRLTIAIPGISFLPKPFELEELLATVRTIVGQPGSD